MMQLSRKLVNQNEMLTESLCQWTDLALIMPVVSWISSADFKTTSLYQKIIPGR